MTSIKLETENTALPTPGLPYPGGASKEYFSRVFLQLSRSRRWYSNGAPAGLLFPRVLNGSGHQVVNLGTIPFDIKNSSPSVVYSTASSGAVNPKGRAISMPATKLGITLLGPKISAASIIL